MTNLDDSTNALFAPKDNSQSFLGSVKNQQPVGVKQRPVEDYNDYMGEGLEYEDQEGGMLTPEELLKQINHDNDVELNSTLWKVLRN